MWMARDDIVRGVREGVEALSLLGQRGRSIGLSVCGVQKMNLPDVKSILSADEERFLDHTAMAGSLLSSPSHGLRLKPDGCST
jgi:hypothetical protein